MKKLSLQLMKLLLMCALVCARVAFADHELKVLLLEKGREIHAELVTAIEQKFKARGIEYVTYSNARDAQSFLDSLNPDEYLVVSVGTESTVDALRTLKHVRILSVALPRVNYLSLADGVEETADGKRIKQFSAIYIDQPISRRVLLLREVLPHANRVSVLLGPTTLGSKEQLIEEFQKYNFTLSISILKNDKNLIGSLDALLDGSDALFGVADPSVFNAANAKNVLLTAYRWRVPLFGISDAYVRAGALAAVYSSPDQIATHLTETVETIRGCEKVCMVEPQYPKYFDIAVNYRVAESLGIVIEGRSAIMEKLLNREAESK